jgi:AcrR family transcriptional regulator
MAAEQAPVEQPRWLAPEDDDDDQPARPALTRRRVVMAALTLVEEHGLEALNMRRVATDLHVTPMSLYNHVADKAELVDLMADFIIGDVVAASKADTGDWETQLRSVVRRNYEMWRTHPGFVKVYTEGITLGPNGVANTERPLRILREAGFTDQEAAEAFFLLYRYSMASLLIAPALAPGAGRPGAPGEPVSRSRSPKQRAARYFSAVPPDQIPNVMATIAYLTGTDLEFGLDVIIAGLRAKLAARNPVPAFGDGIFCDPAFGDGA